MSAQDEEDDRIDALLAQADACQECGVPIGYGRCLGCIAVAASCPEMFEDEDSDD